MKKTVAAVAVLGAFAGSALAADVTLYGVVDAGLVYTHLDQDVQRVDATDKFEMKSGNQAGSRWGLKGVEDLGNGAQVGFILESGFNVDDGSFRTANTLFDREASLFVQGGFGKVAFGKLGSIVQGVSSWGKVGSVSAFGTSFGNYAAQAGAIFATSTVYDNMIAYSTPSFGGVTVYAQYTMGNATENESGDDRLFSLGAQADFGALQVLGLVEYLNKKSVADTTVYDDSQYDDSYTINLGGSYDFGVAKVFLAGQYFKAAPDFAGMKDNYGYLSLDEIGWRFSFDGFGVNVGATAPIGAGEFLVSAGYGKGDLNIDTKDAKISADAYIIQVGYTYPFSKRTNLYAGAGYMQTSMEDGFINTDRTYSDKDFKTTQVMFGLLHKF